MSIRVGVRHMARSAVYRPAIYDAYRKSHEIDGSAEGAQEDYQVKVEVYRKEGADFENRVHVGNKCRTDFGDVRFTKSDMITELDYFLEHVGTSSAYWEKYGGNPILSIEGAEVVTGWSSVLKVGETYHMYYSYKIGGELSIGHATSPDGRAWTKDAANNPVLIGTPGEWDDPHVWVPMVWKEGDTWYMLYTGEGPTQSIGLATSDDGIDWTKEPTNPVLIPTVVWEHGAVENWGIIKIDSTYYLWYNSMWAANREVGLATSNDLKTWNKDASNPIFTGGRFCSFPFKYGDYYYLLVPHYTIGTDYADIELYRDSNPTFYLADRTLVGIAFPCSDSGWDSLDQDTPFILTDDVGRDSFAVANNELWCYYAGSEVGGFWETGITIEPDIASALTLPTYPYALFWVEVDSIPADPDSATIYMYYGKADATTTSDGESTLEFFDDFDDYSIDDPPNVTDWLTQGTGVGNTIDVQADPEDATKKCFRFVESGDGVLLILYLLLGGNYFGLATHFRYRADAYDRLFYFYTQENAIKPVSIRRSHLPGLEDHVRWYDTGVYHEFVPQLTFTQDNWYEIEQRLEDTGEDYLHWIVNGADFTGGMRDAMVNGVAKIWFWPHHTVASIHYIGGVGDDNRYIFCRKFVDPEPSHGDWGSEEALVWPF